MATTGHERHERQGRLDGGAAAGRVPAPSFRGWRWRAGNALVNVFARAGIGPIALLTTTGRVTGRPHTVPVVPIDHAGARWLVAAYGPVGWVHNARAAGTVTLRYGRQRDTYTAREATPAEAGPVLKRYVTIATRARHRFAASVDAPVEAFIAEAADHPVFELQPAPEPVTHAS
jgi:deazaflavin-dependent oxidoreductase (nitroreductase family)